MRKIFVCYAHPNKPVVRQLDTHLRPVLSYRDAFLWSDSDIRAGAMWESSIRAAIDEAICFLIVVSPDMIDSQFITDTEIPLILHAKFARNAPIFCIYQEYSVVSERPYSHPFDTNQQVYLTQFQGLNDPTQPLSTLLPAEQNKVLADAARSIVSTVDELIGFELRASVTANHRAGVLHDLIDSTGFRRAQVVRLEDVRQLITMDARRYGGSTPLDIALSWSDLKKPKKLSFFSLPPGFMASVVERVAATSVYAIVGSPGAGKTTLTKLIAAELVSQFPDRACLYVDLSTTNVDLQRQLPSLISSIAAFYPTRPFVLIDNAHYAFNEAAELVDRLVTAYPVIQVVFSTVPTLPRYYLMLENNVLVDTLNDPSKVCCLDTKAQATHIIGNFCQLTGLDIDNLGSTEAILDRCSNNLHSLSYYLRSRFALEFPDARFAVEHPDQDFAFGPMEDRLVGLSDTYGDDVVLLLFALSAWSRYDVIVEIDYLFQKATPTKCSLGISPALIEALEEQGLITIHFDGARLSNRGVAASVFGSIVGSNIIGQRLQAALSQRGLGKASAENEVIRSYIEFRPTNIYMLSKQVCNEGSVLAALSRSEAAISAIADMIVRAPNVMLMAETFINFEWQNHTLSTLLMGALIERKDDILKRLMDEQRILPIAHLIAPMWYVERDSELKKGKELFFQPHHADPHRRALFFGLECPFLTDFADRDSFAASANAKVSAYVAEAGLNPSTVTTQTTSCIKAFNRQYNGAVKCAKMLVANVKPGRILFEMLPDDLLVHRLEAEEQPHYFHYAISVFRYMSRGKTEQLVSRISGDKLVHCVSQLPSDERVSLTSLLLDLRPGAMEELMQRRLLNEAEIARINSWRT